MRITDNNLSILDLFTILSFMLQVANYESDVKSASNDDLMRELQKQDRDYFEQIIENQNKILKRLADLG